MSLNTTRITKLRVNFSAEKIDNIFDLLKELKFGPENFEEIVIRPGQLVDFTLKNKNCA